MMAVMPLPVTHQECGLIWGLCWSKMIWISSCWARTQFLWYIYVISSKGLYQHTEVLIDAFECLTVFICHSAVFLHWHNCSTPARLHLLSLILHDLHSLVKHHLRDPWQLTNDNKFFCFHMHKCAYVASFTGLVPDGANVTEQREWWWTKGVNMNGRNVSGNEGWGIDGCVLSTGGWWSQAVGWRLMQAGRQPRSWPPILQTNSLLPPPAEWRSLSETMPALSTVSPQPPRNRVTKGPCIVHSHPTASLT